MNESTIKRVGLIFSGGPAPGANAVISAAASAFMAHDIEVIGIFHGYSNLQEYGPSHPLIANEHYRVFTAQDISGLRNARGVLIGTARSTPGWGLHSIQDLKDSSKTLKLRNCYQALRSLEIDALVSIGGDGTLTTANFLWELQNQFDENEPRIHIVHVPKTIDNDYGGIDFTFGFFTAVDVLTKELLNLRADAIATSSYFIVETMGRKSGWISYGVSIAGEANGVIAPEDIGVSLQDESGCLCVRKLSNRIVDLIFHREKSGKHYGTVVLAEGLTELVSNEKLNAFARGNSIQGKPNFAELIAHTVSQRYEERIGRRKKIRGMQLGYESRCAPPHAFDVILGAQLGVGAYRALVEEALDGHMVSVTGQFELQYIPFRELIDQQTMLARVRHIEPKSDFHRLARFLETRTDRILSWIPARRTES